MVKNDYRTADVFRKWGINYCCGGNLPLPIVCELQALDIDLVETELEQAVRTVQLPASTDYQKWPVSFLVSYLSYVHHEYLKASIPPLLTLVHSFTKGHEKPYPYMPEVAAIMDRLDVLIKLEMDVEETLLFPYLHQLHNTYERKETYGRLFVKTVQRSMFKQQEEHNQRIMELLDEMRKLTNGYTFADTVCTNHQVIYHKLRELDNDLQQHFYLEKEVLLPKAVVIENELLLYQ